MDNKNHISLEEHAYELVEQDKANVVLSLELIEKDKKTLQLQLKKKATDTFKILKKISGVESSTQGQSIQDNLVLTDGKWEKQGFKGIYSILVISYDFEQLNKAIEAVEDIAQVSQIQTSISSKKQLASEDALTQKAIDNFNKRANLITKSFGFDSFILQNVDVPKAESEHRNRYDFPSMSRSSALMDKEQEEPGNSFYIEPRQEKISITLRGSIVMIKKGLLSHD